MKTLLLVLATASCATAHSSREILTLDQSSTTLHQDPAAAAREVTRLLGTRGFPLVDQRMTPSGQRLEFRGARDLTVGGFKGNTGSTQYGSAFYAWIRGNGDATSVILVGWPTVDHRDWCSLTGTELECQNGFSADSNHISGYDEAQVVHGVLSELAVEGLTTAPVVAR